MIMVILGYNYILLFYIKMVPAKLPKHSDVEGMTTMLSKYPYMCQLTDSLESHC